MKETIQEINSMVAAGVIEQYAIGGAVGATFYVEPIATIDLDIFVSFTSSPGSGLISLSPIYSYMTGNGHSVQGEYILVNGWPVQFLAPGNALEEEAIVAATVTDLDGTGVRIMTAEHLAAIALRLGRPKDHARLVQFVEAGILDSGMFDEILSRHGLVNKWKKFETRFLT